MSSSASSNVVVILGLFTTDFCYSQILSTSVQFFSRDETCEFSVNFMQFRHKPNEKFENHCLQGSKTRTEVLQLLALRLCWMKVVARRGQDSLASSRLATGRAQ
jgi:hypothetical protein